MIVVAIIGILVAVAAPNFARYQSKARQAEAKLALGGGYGLEKAFYAEYNAYIPEYAAIGFSPDGSKRFYSIGWGGSWSGTITGFTNPGTPAPNFVRVNFPASWTECPANAWLGATPAANATDPQAYTITAAGQLRDGIDCDVWTITETKLLVNSQIGL